VIRLDKVAQGDIKARKVKDEKEDERWDLLTESLRLQNETVELASEERRLVAQQVKEIKEEGEVIRKGLASDDLEARHVKDLKEDKRWAVLNESLRQQKETVELASEERLLVAQQVKDIKDEREVMRLGLALDDLKARDVKDRKEDERWELLNESLRLQKETVELASEERLIVAQQVKDIKDEGEIMRKGLASDDLEARHIKENKEEKRWNELYERLRIQEERSEERDRLQVLRDEEYVRMRHEDGLRDQYRTLFRRYVRNSAGNTLNPEVADGLAPIPEAWLREQPEILKNPALMQLLAPYNER
jgi:phosphopantetheine adenylyltransferase